MCCCILGISKILATALNIYTKIMYYYESWRVLESPGESWRVLESPGVPVRLRTAVMWV